MQDFILLVVAVLAAVGCAFFYIAAMLDGHRSLSRSAAVAFFVFSLIVAVYFRRIL